MFQLLLHVYVFLAWTGAWSTHSGWGALLFLLLWGIVLALGVAGAFFAPSILSNILSLSMRLGFGKNTAKMVLNVADAIDIAMNAGFMFPILGLAGIVGIGYFIGMGDLLNWMSSTLFPEGGYLFSEASIPFWAFIAPLYLAYTWYATVDRFDGIEAIKQKARELKAKFLNDSINDNAKENEK